MLAEINHAITRKRTELHSALRTCEEQLRDLRDRQSAALDALAFQAQGVLERTRAALAAHADEAVLACDEVEGQIRTLKVGLQILDQRARSVEDILTDPNLHLDRWQAPEAFMALKRALNLLVHSLTLEEQELGAFHVKVERYEIRQSLVHESAFDKIRTKIVTTKQ